MMSDPLHVDLLETPAEIYGPNAVNLCSDTQTRPSKAMREAMAYAPVGDEQLFADPTVNELQDRVAELLGHEAAVFLPSGTMCNEIALRLHVRPGGDEVLVHRRAHIIGAESGGPSTLSGAMIAALDGDGGMFTAETVRANVRAPSRYAPRSRLVCVEQTANQGGGRVWPLEQLDGVVGAAREHGLRTHMDGARLLNAVVSSGVPAARYAEQFDTVWIDFSKGLGAPVGGVLAGSRELIDDAWRYKQMWGGALRQGGIVAAGALYALDHNVERLADDHDNARHLAQGLARIDGVSIDTRSVETNIVFFEVADAPVLKAALERSRVLIGIYGRHRVRVITHLDVDRAGVDLALALIEDHLSRGVA